MTKIREIRNNLIIHKDITEELDIATLELTTDYIDKILTYANKLKLKYSSL